MRTKRWMVVAATAMLLMTNGMGARASAAGLVVDDRAGDSPAWSDLTQFRIDTVLDGSAQATALQVTFRTDEAPGDDDARRPWFSTAWTLTDPLQPRCTANIVVFDNRAGPAGSLGYQCDGDSAKTTVLLGAADIQLATVPGSDDVATTVTIPLALFAQGQSNGRYHGGTVLKAIAATSGVLIGSRGVTTDFAGEVQLLPVQDGNGSCVCPVPMYTYAIGS
jgi:hypothetical protein